MEKLADQDFMIVWIIFKSFATLNTKCLKKKIFKNFSITKLSMETSHSYMFALLNNIECYFLHSHFSLC